MKGIAIVLLLAVFLVTVFYSPQILSFFKPTSIALLSPTPSILSPTLTSSPSAIPTPTESGQAAKIIISLTPSPTKTITTNTPPSTGYAYLSLNTNRGIFATHVITLPLSAKMVTDSASDGDCDNDCPTLTLQDFVNRNGAFAGINGTYFCPTTYDECQSKKNSTDFPVFNSRLNKWISEKTLFWNSRSLIYQDGGGMHFMQDAKSFGGGLNSGIVNYPGLLNNGQSIVDAFPLSAKQSGKSTAGGIGFGSNIHLVVANNVNMHDLAAIFKALGDSYALNLDGGGSSVLWYGGYKYGPGRNLPNAVLFK